MKAVRTFLVALSVCWAGLVPAEGDSSVQRPDGRIPLWGSDRIPRKKGWFSEQSEGVSSLPTLFKTAHSLATMADDSAGAWMLTVGDVDIPVCDYATASDRDDSANRYSIRFSGGIKLT